MTIHKPMLRLAAVLSLCATGASFATENGLPSRITEGGHYAAFDYAVSKENPSPDADAGLLYEALWSDTVAYCDARGGYLASYDNHRRGVAYLAVGNLKDTAFATCGMYPEPAGVPPRASRTRLLGGDRIRSTGDALRLIATGDRLDAYKLVRTRAYAFCRDQGRRITDATFSYQPRAQGGYSVETFVRCEASASLP